MENQNPNANKRYNKFRQARRKKDKFNTINVDEVSGRNYTLERFLRDCILHLPKHKQECEDDMANTNVDSTTPKTSRQKHVKLPVLNECKGLFENVIIGRSAKKVGGFGETAATPEDRARLHEDIHALAKVGPDSELSFELFPHSPLRSQPVDVVQDRQELQERPVSPPERRVTDTSSLKAPGGSWPEEHNQTRRSRSPNEPNVEASGHEDIFQEHVFNDSGFKDTGGSHREDAPPRSSSFHCDCCRKTRSPRNFFEAEVVLNSNEPSEADPQSLGAIGNGINVPFSNQKDPSWLFEDAPGGPTNSLGSTYRPRNEPPFDFEGIEIQSIAPEHFGPGAFGDECRDVYTGRYREPPAGLGMLKRRIPWTGFNKDVKRYNMHHDRDPRFVPTDNVCLPHLSTYNKFRYNRSLSPRKY